MLEKKILLCKICGNSIGVLTGKESMVCCDHPMETINKEQNRPQIIYNPIAISHIPGVEVKVLHNNNAGSIQKVQIKANNRSYFINIDKSKTKEEEKFTVAIS